MSFKRNDVQLPEFFHVNKCMTEDGNIVNVNVVAANSNVRLYSNNPKGEQFTMIYPWANKADSPVEKWIWTDLSVETLTEAARLRFSSMGYEPVTFVTGEYNVEYPMYAQIQDGSSLEYSPCRFIEYFPGAKVRSLTPSVMCSYDVYALGSEQKHDPIRNEYIFGLNQLHGRLRDSEHPIEETPILILNGLDVEPVADRWDTIKAAVNMGYTSSDLKYLIDLLACGAVVYDTRRKYKLSGIDGTVRRQWYNYHGQKLLSANEFYETVAYRMDLKLGIYIADKLWSKVQQASQVAHQSQREGEMCRDAQLIRCNRG